MAKTLLYITLSVAILQFSLEAPAKQNSASEVAALFKTALANSRDDTRNRSAISDADSEVTTARMNASSVSRTIPDTVFGLAVRAIASTKKQNVEERPDAIASTKRQNAEERPDAIASTKRQNVEERPDAIASTKRQNAEERPDAIASTKRQNVEERPDKLNDKHLDSRKKFNVSTIVTTATTNNFITYILQFEDGLTTQQNSRLAYRPKASNNMTLHLIDQENSLRYTITLCVKSIDTRKPVQMQITDLGYSNDGPSDTITLALDGQVAGSASTVEHFAAGSGWDNPQIISLKTPNPNVNGWKPYLDSLCPYGPMGSGFRLYGNSSSKPRYQSRYLMQS